MKKILSILLVILTIMSFISTISVSANQEVDIYVNGELLETDQPAIIANGRTLVPLRAICEALKCEVTWDADTQTAQIQNPITIISVQINNYKLTKVDRETKSNERIIEIDVPPVIHNGRTLVPARAIAEALHAIVQWNEVSKQVNIKLEYDSIDDFDDNGLARVSLNDKFGFINENREVEIPIIYDMVYYFDYYNYCIVKKDSKYAFIDKNGNVLNNKWYEDLERQLISNKTYFMDGAVAAKMNGKWGLIDIDGKIIMPYTYDDIGYSMRGDVRIWVKKNGKWGGISSTGIEVVPCIYDEIGSYNWTEDHVWVKKDGKWGAIYCNGRTVKEFKYAYPAIYKTGGDMYQIEDDETGKMGLMDTEGNVVIPPLYDYIYGGTETFSVKNDGKEGMLNRDGSVRIPIIYDEMKSFGNGIVVARDGKWGVYDSNGNERHPCVFENMYNYNDTIKVFTGDKWGVLNEDWSILIPYTYDSVTEYDNLFMVSLNGKNGALNKDGSEIVPCLYDYWEGGNDTYTFYDYASGNKLKFRAKIQYINGKNVVVEQN